MDKSLAPKFHISLPCVDVDKTKLFYLNELGLTIGREAENWIDINFTTEKCSLRMVLIN